MEQCYKVGNFFLAVPLPLSVALHHKFLSCDYGARYLKFLPKKSLVCPKAILDKFIHILENLIDLY